MHRIAEHNDAKVSHPARDLAYCRAVSMWESDSFRSYFVNMSCGSALKSESLFFYGKIPLLQNLSTCLACKALKQTRETVNVSHVGFWGTHSFTAAFHTFRRMLSGIVCVCS